MNNHDEESTTEQRLMVVVAYAGVAVMLGLCAFIGYVIWNLS